MEKSRTKQSSRSHRVISQTLDLMRVAHRNEYEEDVDVAIVLEEDSAWTHTAIRADLDEYNVASARDEDDGDARRGGHLRVAVEFDGPYHFTALASTGRVLESIESGAVKLTPHVLGHTVLKYIPTLEEEGLDGGPHPLL